MNKQRQFILGLTAVLMFLLSSPASAGGPGTFAGEALSDVEMADIRGGFSLPNGDYMALSLDFMSLRMLTQTDSLQPNATGWVNALNQHARITDKGIEFDMGIFQGGSLAGPNAGGSHFLVPSQTNQANVLGSFNNFSGLANANIITGNFNTATNVNIFNIKVDYIKGADFSRHQLTDFIGF